MKIHLIKLPIILLSFSAAMLTGCVAPQAQPPKTTQIKCRIPTIEIVADPVNTEKQTKGGLEITAAHALYKGERKTHTIVRQIPPPPLALILGGSNGQKIYVEKNTTTELEPSPARLEFNVKINNLLNRVFHAQGAVVQFNVDGKLIPYNDKDYQEFTGGIVPPRNQETFVIDGPSLNLLKNKGNISFSLYDVVTATDAAGNVTERQNYTWDFTYTMQDVTETAANTTEQGWMDAAGYQQIIMQQQMQQLQRQPQDNPAQ